MNQPLSWHTCSVFQFITLQIEDLRAKDRFGTAEKYQKALSSLRKFFTSEHPLGIGQHALTDLNFSHFDPSLVYQYETWLQHRGCCRNTSSFYLRILRACYNKALQTLSDIPPQVISNPFSEVYTGVDRTRKRALPTHVFSQLLHHSALPSVRMQPDLLLARDIFLFSFYTRGMSFVDIAYMRSDNLQDNTLSYVRRKTHQRLIVHLEPEAMQIIHQYSTSDRPFLFPILKGGTEAELYEQYKLALTHYLYYLHLFESGLAHADVFSIDQTITLTFYVARHTWASSMLRLGAALPVISQGLGHHSLEVTQIYLAEVSQSEIDMANRKLLDTL